VSLSQADPGYPSHPPLARLGRGPLVARDRELAVLASCLEDARAGRPGVVLLAGEAGIGKTRLLDELPLPEDAEGITVLRGGASQDEGIPPYLPLLEALGEYVAVAELEVLRGDLGSDAALLATLLPEISARLGVPATADSLPPERGRLRLYEAVGSFLEAIAARGALVLVLDDLQWADDATCDLLVHLVRRSRSVPLLVVGAYREAEENAAFGRAMAELNRLRRLVTVRLRPLAEHDTRTLASGLLRGDLAPEAATMLHRHGEGNPFFEEELLRALVEGGVLVPRGGGWDLMTEPARLLPPGILGAVRLRLGRLAPEVVDVLRVAAIVGRRFQVDLLAAVTSLDAEELETHLFAAARAGLVRPEPDGGYAFTHDKIREAVASEVGHTRRRRLHLAIGEAIEAAPEADARRATSELAYHFVQASEADRGVIYALAAGQEALRAHAPAEAADHFRSAERLLAANPDPARHTAALLGLGDAARLVGDYGRAATHYRAAVTTATKAGEDVTTAVVWRRLGEVLWRMESVHEARAAFRRALELLGSTHGKETAELLLQLADLHALSLGEHEAGVALGEQALALVTRLGDRRLEATASRVLGNLKMRTSELTVARELLERALSLARQDDDPVLAAEACGHLANLYWSLGNLRRSWEITALREELALRTRDPFQLRHVDAWRAVLHAARGEWAAAAGLLERAEQLAERLESPEPLTFLRWVRGRMRYCQGRFEDAVEEYRAVVEAARSFGSGPLIWYLGGFGLALAELDRRDEALSTLAELESLVAARHERAVESGYAFACLVLAYDRLGERERTAACYMRLLPYRGLFDLLLFDRALGIAAAARGDYVTARHHLEDAEGQARREGLRPSLALTLLQRGRLERELGSHGDQAARGHAAIAEGLQICAELGMENLGRRTLGEPSTPSGRPAWPGGLTDRQVEVLCLVAQGHTNREIAETLVLSERTVANHLTAIFTKIDVDNRAGATAYALRNGLA
jgi:predicted ATPase/DNA-binding CsgD family transcriptional regulator